MTGLQPEPTIMLVDDDEIDLMQFTRQLKKHGGFGQIYAFDRPEDALSFIGDERNSRIDVLLLDMKMPTMSGFQFLKQANAQFGQGFVGSVAILTTLSLAEMHLERAMPDPSVRAYLKKPLTTSDLNRIIKIVGAVRAEAQQGPATPGRIELTAPDHTEIASA